MNKYFLANLEEIYIHDNLIEEFSGFEFLLDKETNIHIEIDGNPDRMLIATFSFGSLVMGDTAFILDLDTVAQNLTGIEDIESALEVVGELRIAEKLVFESAITEGARQELFGGYEVISDDSAAKE